MPVVLPHGATAIATMSRGQSSGHVHPWEQDKSPLPTVSVCGICEHVFFSYTHTQKDRHTVSGLSLPSGRNPPTSAAYPAIHPPITVEIQSMYLLSRT